MTAQPSQAEHASQAKDVTYVRVAAIALPVVVSNATVPLQSAIDTAIIGNLGSEIYLAAVTLGGAVMALVLQVFNFLQFGAGALGAQALGARDHRRVINVLARALILAVGIAVLLILAQGPLARQAMRIFEASAEAEDLAALYFSIRIWAAPAELANFALMGWFSGQELTRRLFEMQLVVSVSNIVLNLIFVLGLGMDVDGVALGTLIAAYIGLGFGLWRARARMAWLMPDWRPERKRLLNRAELIGLMRLNRDIFIRTMILVGSFTWMTRLGSLQGDVILAANGILFQIFHLASYALDGFAIAVESLVGQAVGAKDRRFLRRAVVVSTICAFVVSGLLAALLLAIHVPLITLFTNVADVRTETLAYFFWAALFPVIGVLAFQMDGIFVGAAAGPAMRNAMIVSGGIYLAISTWSLEVWGNHGVWGAIWAFLILRGVTLLVQYPALERRIADT
ncbi:MAG: MATE family efflux transporter [Pseudomonadota bacterium]